MDAITTKEQVLQFFRNAPRYVNGMDLINATGSTQDVLAPIVQQLIVEGHILPNSDPNDRSWVWAGHTGFDPMYTAPELRPVVPIEALNKGFLQEEPLAQKEVEAAIVNVGYKTADQDPVLAETFYAVSFLEEVTHVETELNRQILIATARVYAEAAFRDYLEFPNSDSNIDLGHALMAYENCVSHVKIVEF